MQFLIRVLAFDFFFSCYFQQELDSLQKQTTAEQEKLQEEAQASKEQLETVRCVLSKSSGNFDFWKCFDLQYWIFFFRVHSHAPHVATLFCNTLIDFILFTYLLCFLLLFQMRRRLREQQQQRDTEHADHAAMLRELQQVVATERSTREDLEAQVRDSTEVLLSLTKLSFVYQ